MNLENFQSVSSNKKIFIIIDAMGNFQGGAESRPEGPRIRAEARRAEAAGDGVQGKGCPLLRGKKFFDF